MARRTIAPEVKARTIAVAKSDGVAIAAQREKIHPNTINRWLREENGLENRNGRKLVKPMRRKRSRRAPLAGPAGNKDFLEVIATAIVQSIDLDAVGRQVLEHLKARRAARK